MTSLEKTGYCKICGKVRSQHFHRVSTDVACNLSEVSGKQVAKGDLVCCRHFLYHEVKRFTKKHPAQIQREFATAALISPSKRELREREMPGPSKNWLELSPSELKRLPKHQCINLLSKAKLRVSNAEQSKKELEQLKSQSILDVIIQDSERSSRSGDLTVGLETYWFGVSSVLSLADEVEQQIPQITRQTHNLKRKQQLYLTLLWLRQGVSYKVLKLLSKIPESTLRYINSNMLDDLYRYYFRNIYEDYNVYDLDQFLFLCLVQVGQGVEWSGFANA